MLFRSEVDAAGLVQATTLMKAEDDSFEIEVAAGAKLIDDKGFALTALTMIGLRLGISRLLAFACF